MVKTPLPSRPHRLEEDRTRFESGYSRAGSSEQGEGVYKPSSRLDDELGDRRSRTPDFRRWGGEHAVSRMDVASRARVEIPPMRSLHDGPGAFAGGRGPSNRREVRSPPHPDLGTYGSRQFTSRGPEAEATAVVQPRHSASGSSRPYAANPASSNPAKIGDRPHPLSYGPGEFDGIGQDRGFGKRADYGQSYHYGDEEEQEIDRRHEEFKAMGGRAGTFQREPVRGSTYPEQVKPDLAGEGGRARAQPAEPPSKAAGMHTDTKSDRALLCVKFVRRIASAGDAIHSESRSSVEQTGAVPSDVIRCLCSECAAFLVHLRVEEGNKTCHGIMPLKALLWVRSCLSAIAPLTYRPFADKPYWAFQQVIWDRMTKPTVEDFSFTMKALAVFEGTRGRDGHAGICESERTLQGFSGSTKSLWKKVDLVVRHCNPQDGLWAAYRALRKK